MTASALADFKCVDCGQSSVGYYVTESIEDDVETLTTFSVCNDHIPAGLE